MNPKCPHCDQSVTNLDLYKLDAQETWQGPKIQAVVFTCPNAECRAILGVRG